jgi:hypothetical protein
MLTPKPPRTPPSPRAVVIAIHAQTLTSPAKGTIARSSPGPGSWALDSNSTPPPPRRLAGEWVSPEPTSSSTVAVPSSDSEVRGRAWGRSLFFGLLMRSRRALCHPGTRFLNMQCQWQRGNLKSAELNHPLPPRAPCLNASHQSGFPPSHSWKTWNMHSVCGCVAEPPARREPGLIITC